MWLDALDRDSKATPANRLAVLGRALTDDPSDVNLLRRLWGLASAKGPEGEQATAILRQQLAEGKNVGMAHLALGTIAWQSGRIDEGRMHLEQAYKIGPHVAAVANNLAWVLAYSEPPQYERALEIIGRVVDTYPKEPQFRGTRGRILAKMKHGRMPFPTSKPISRPFRMAPNFTRFLPMHTPNSATKCYHLSIGLGSQNAGKTPREPTPAKGVRHDRSVCHVCLLCCMGFGTTVRAQSPIVTFDFATAVGNEATFNATAKDTNISNTPQISRANLTITAQQSGSEFSASGFTTSGTIVTSQYFSFTITPASGYDVNVSSIDVRTATQFFGPSTIELRSSAGTTPFSTTLATYSTNNTNPQNAQFNGFSVSGLNGTPLEFRIYGYGAGFAGSAFGFVSNMTAGTPGSSSTAQ